MPETPADVADRLDRAADRYQNASDFGAAHAARQAAAQARRARSLADAQVVEQQFFQSRAQDVENLSQNRGCLGGWFGGGGRSSGPWRSSSGSRGGRSSGGTYYHDRSIHTSSSSSSSHPDTTGRDAFVAGAAGGAMRRDDDDRARPSAQSFEGSAGEDFAPPPAGDNS